MNRDAGSTLLEMLAVMAVTAILAGVAFPAYSSSVSASKRVTCIGNLHQIGIAATVYAQEYDDAYPFAIDEIDRKFHSNLYARPDWLQLKDHLDQIPSVLDVYRPYVSTAVFQCPSDASVGPDGKSTNVTSMFWFQSFGSSYSFAPTLSGLRSWQISDSRLTYVSDAEPFHSPPGDWRRNCLFFDGHVAYTKIAGAAL